MSPLRQPVFFISHGGGPWPFMVEMQSAMHGLRQSLASIPGTLPEAPKAIVIVTAHWEEDAFCIGANPQPGMIYDYQGFPPHTYQLSYPAPGLPVLARQIQRLLHAAQLPARLDGERGFDHGTFVPLAVMYPDADIPIVQMSLKKGLAPQQHLAMGQALISLRDEGVLIIGSGLSYHNLRLFGPAGTAPSQAFDAWLQDVIVSFQGESRAERLLRWTEAPFARTAHPREEHLLPLMVAAGAAGADAAVCNYHETGVFGGVTVSSFRFG